MVVEDMAVEDMVAAGMAVEATAVGVMVGMVGMVDITAGMAVCFSAMGDTIQDTTITITHLIIPPTQSQPNRPHPPFMSRNLRRRSPITGITALAQRVITLTSNAALPVGCKWSQRVRITN